MRRQSKVPSEVSVTIVIPTYNAIERLTDLLSSIAASRHDDVIQVLVCDDGSTQDARSAVQAYSRELPIKCLRQSRRGFRAAAARNLGIREARGNVVLFLDSDVVVHGGFLDAHVAAHANAKGSRLVFGFRRRVIAPPEPSPTGSLGSMFESDHREGIVGPDGTKLGEQSEPWYYVFTCNVSVSGPVRRQLFDETFVGWGNEDVEYAYRAWREGAEIACAPKAWVWHVEDASPRDPYRCEDASADFTSVIVNTVRIMLKFPLDTAMRQFLLRDLVGYRVRNGRVIRDHRCNDPTALFEWASERIKYRETSFLDVAREAGE